MDKISINDNVRYNKNNSLNIDNDTFERLDISPVQADAIADMLLDEFGHGDKDSRPFYCKVAYYISHSRIDYLVTQAKEKGRNPGALFNWLASKEMPKSEQKIDNQNV